MEIISSEVNCLGTMSFTLKIGKMRKAKEFVVYPIQSGDKKVLLQARGFWAELMLSDGSIECTKNHGNFANNLSLIIDKAQNVSMSDKATEEQMTYIKDAIRKTSGKMVGGNGIIYCDNSGAISI